MGFLERLLKKETRKVISNVEDSFDGGESVLRERIEKIVAEEWADYELKREVPSSVMAAPAGARAAYSYGIYKDNSPKAMIMILSGNNDYRRKEVRLARMACEDKQVAYMNFMSYMANRPEYISERLKKEIRG